MFHKFREFSCSFLGLYSFKYWQAWELDEEERLCQEAEEDEKRRLALEEEDRERRRGKLRWLLAMLEDLKKACEEFPMPHRKVSVVDWVEMN